MTNLTAFLSQNKIKQENIKFVASNNFIDENKKPIEWEIRAISQNEADELRKSCTKRVKIAGKGYINETDTDLYMSKVAAACTVFPDLKNKELQDSYKVMGDDQLLKAMLSLGEYTTYIQKISDINGFDISLDEAVDEAKN